MHKPNGILITPFYDDPSDCELKKLHQFLKFLSNVYDVRPIEEWRKTFNFSCKIKYLDFRKEKQIYLNEVSPRTESEKNKLLGSFASQKKEIG